MGELIAGAYLRLGAGCQVVTYNQRSPESGNQTETDVVAIHTEDGDQTVYACEVVTHLGGINYSTRKDTSGWAQFNSAADSLKRLWDKFENDHQLMTSVFDDADNYRFQLWSPVVREGNMTDGLTALKTRFESTYDTNLVLIYNADYSARVQELRDRAAAEEKHYEEPAFRFLQIIEHLR